MLQELDKMAKSKEEFLAAYRPVRESFEKFLQKGKHINGERVKQVLAYFTSFMSGHREVPYYLREARSSITGASDMVQITVKTDGYLYPYSDKIENSIILVSVRYDRDSNGPLAVLPPVRAFEKNELPWSKYADIPNRVAQLIPLLPQD